MSPSSFTIRAVTPADVSLWCLLRHMLWPQVSVDDHAHETEQLFAKSHCYAMVIAASSKNEALGFAEAAIRHDYVNGCDTSPVLFLEGIYVVPPCVAKVSRERYAHQLSNGGFLMDAPNLLLIPLSTMSMRRHYTVHSALMKPNVWCFSENVRVQRWLATLVNSIETYFESLKTFLAHAGRVLRQRGAELGCGFPCSLLVIRRCASCFIW